MKLTSPYFNDGDMLPVKYTCDGEKTSPELHWRDVPAGTKTFVLMCEDPDAPSGIWIHWILYNLPSNISSLMEGIHKLPQNTSLGMNSWQRVGYGAPCPPRGIHRYIFKLYALDTGLGFDSIPSRQAILQAIKGHTLAEAQLETVYTRQR